MQRVIKVVEKMMQDYDENGDVNNEYWRDEYTVAVKNKIDPAYKLSKANTWKPIINENFEGSQRYFGLLQRECVDV